MLFSFPGIRRHPDAARFIPPAFPRNIPRAAGNRSSASCTEPSKIDDARRSVPLIMVAALFDDAAGAAVERKMPDRDDVHAQRFKRKRGEPAHRLGHIAAAPSLLAQHIANHARTRVWSAGCPHAGRWSRSRGRFPFPRSPKPPGFAASFGAPPPTLCGFHAASSPPPARPSGLFA